MKGRFEIAGGSVIGRDHARTGKNNQDAFVWRQTEDFTIAVVADGCGSGRFSEAGAQIGARFFIESLEKPHLNIEAEIEYARRNLLKELEKLIEKTERRSESVKEYFLFTLVGAIITTEYSALFHIGDGIICENGKITELGPYPDNQPPYLAYDLFDQSKTGFAPQELKFKIHSIVKTSDVQSILIGTDGVADLIRAFPLNQFWENDLYFKNPDAVRRRLAIMNRESVKIDWEKGEVSKEGGLLPDDTTLVVIRRKNGGEDNGNIC